MRVFIFDKLFWAFLLVALHSLPISGRDICVYNQKQFEKVVTRINRGEEISIVLHRGRYYLKEAIVANSPLTIKGRNATITCSGVFTSNDAVEQTQSHFIYKVDDVFPPFTIFYKDEKVLLPIAESVIDSVGVNYVEGEIQASTDFKQEAIIKIPIPSNLKHLKNKEFSCAFGYFDSGWCVVDYELVRADDSFFYCKALNGCSTNNVMYDKTFYKREVRFVIYNAELKTGAVYYDTERLYVPKNAEAVFYVPKNDKNHQLPSITLNSDITICGVHFEGIGGVVVNSPRYASCEIKDCTFEMTNCNTLSIKKDNGRNVQVASVMNCSFYDCGIQEGSALYLTSNYEGQTCIEVRGCTISRYPESIVTYKNTGGPVRVNGDVSLYNNIIYNTCRDHLYLYGGTIRIYGNMLYNTDAFSARIDRNLSSDWGLIYCDHYYSDKQKAIDNKLHRIVIENNLLYGAYAYGGDARGIFIDNGRGDVTCRNNVILNTQICAIDSWYWRTNEASSVRNRYEGNIVTSNYRLLTGPSLSGSNRPVVRRNLLLGTQNNIIGDISEEIKDKRLAIDYSSTLENGKVAVSRELYYIIMKSPAGNSVKKYLKNGYKQIPNR